MKQALLAALVTLMIGQPHPPPPYSNRPSPPNRPQPQQSQQFSTDGPWNRDIAILRSRDGLSFQNQRILVERAGVPHVVRSGDTLIATFQWFPFDRREAFDRVAVAFSSDNGRTWTKPEPIVISGMPSHYQRPFDPTLAVLSDGSIRIYFTSSLTREMGPNQTTAILSAISDDGIHYHFEEGVRAASDASPHDCSVVFWKEQWHLFANTRIHKGYHAVSPDGLNFEQLPDMLAPPGTQFIGNALVLDSTTLRYYGARQGGTNGVWSGTSKDGTTWKIDAGTRARGGDASVIRLADTEYLMLVCGEIRPDAGPSPFDQRSPFSSSSNTPRPPPGAR